jgi:hypothetical protein
VVAVAVQYPTSSRCRALHRRSSSCCPTAQPVADDAVDHAVDKSPPLLVEAVADEIRLVLDRSVVARRPRRAPTGSAEDLRAC